MITRKITIAIGIGIALLSFHVSRAIQVGDPNKPWSEHSYEQAPPQEAQVIKEDIPIIIHTPPLEIPSSKDFLIAAVIKNIGAGTPIIHYRFGTNNKYYTRVLHQVEPGTYGLKILSAALVDDKLDYYIEVSTGAKSLASLGSEKEPMSIKIVSAGPPIWSLALGLVAVAGIALIRPVFRKIKYRSVENPVAQSSKKSAFSESAEKLAKLR